MSRMPLRALVIPAAIGAVAVLAAVPASAATAAGAGATAQAPSHSAVSVPDIARPAAANVLEHYSGDHWGSTGRCGAELCLYYNSNEQGAGAAFNADVYDLAGYVWPNNGAGAGQQIKNNAASAEDQSNGEDEIFVNHGWAGNVDWLNPGSYGQLYYTYNNEASLDVW